MSKAANNIAVCTFQEYSAFIPNTSATYYVISQVNERKAVRCGQEAHLEKLSRGPSTEKPEGIGDVSLLTNVRDAGRLAGQTAQNERVNVKRLFTH